MAQHLGGQATAHANKLRPNGHIAVEAVNNKVRAMACLSGDGAGMMSAAFEDDRPSLVLADLTTLTRRDVQAGYRFLFMGSQQAIRNPVGIRTVQRRGR
jgi:hypothetical protein